jgi:hypothetical protein
MTHRVSMRSSDGSTTAVRSALDAQMLKSEARQLIGGGLGRLRQQPRLPGGMPANLLQQSWAVPNHYLAPRIRPGFVRALLHREGRT